MTAILEPYGSPTAVESAIKAAAVKAFAEDKSVSINERIRQEHFRRFLSRIFADEAPSRWILKGGTSIISRVPAARATTDVDLLCEDQELASALSELRNLAKADIGDHFHFVYRSHRPLKGKEQQSQVDGYQVSFDTYVGAKKTGGFHVDLVVGSLVTGEVQRTEPAGALQLPRLPSSPYRLYPVIDQVADKVCATLADYSGSKSSRERDLVDLVVLATTHDFDAEDLRYSIQMEAHHRSVLLPRIFEVPSSWGSGYVKAARSVPACSPFRTVGDALQLMTSFLDPVLDGSLPDGRWSHEQQRWIQRPLGNAAAN